MSTADRRSTDEQLEDQAEEQPVLVPIQLELDVDTFKIRDSFVWNIRGTTLSSQFRLT